LGKGDRRALHKRAPLGLPGLAPIANKNKPPRDAQGKFAGPQEDVRVVALNARARHLGKNLSSNPVEAGAMRKQVSAPWLGDPLGRVIERMVAEDQQELNRLWQVWLTYTGVMRTYRKRILGITGSPAATYVLRVSVTKHLDPDERQDTRTDEEKDDDARASWKAWQGRLNSLLPGDRSALVQAEAQTGKSLWIGLQVSPTGHRTYDALKRLADLVERER
jgi:hypothetical protein